MMKLIASYSKPEEAYLAASLLEGNGIAVNVRDADTVGNYWMYSNAVGGVKLEVADADEARAREVLNLPGEANGLLVCPHCGSGKVRMRQMNLITAMSLALGVMLPFATKKIDCMDCAKSFEFKPRHGGADTEASVQDR
jgi:hypothetical protein